MVEGEKGSRQANGSPEAAPCQRRPKVPDVGEGRKMPPGDVARLLAAVGVLLGSHAPSDLVVVPREELERREFAAYGQGWRDSAAQKHRVAEWADGPPAADADDRTPGQAAVIPFRRRLTSGVRDDARSGVADLPGPASARAITGRLRPTPDAADPPDPETTGPTPSPPAPTGHDTAPAPTGPGSAAPAPTGPGSMAPAPTGPGSAAPAPTDPGPAAPAPADPGSTDPPSTGPVPVDAQLDTPALARPATPARPPAFVLKNRRSKVPTIPRLPRPRQGRPDGRN
ncbi:hypothetical protein [Streptomyces sp. NPDC096323]|uniref:hypothetical protein n=1 Tax=Streptomyces sp. NPDC096323 TaxID=3155822 RepID=UPI0033251C7E